MSIIFLALSLPSICHGGIWGYVGRVYLYRKQRMSVINASKSVLLETLLILASGLFVSLAVCVFSTITFCPNIFPVAICAL